ncbi:DUF881 domain-containing protein [Streptomyces viridodiastaticus]|uniref:DUF881 domain-containing protein n=1 Tax=Streptomyces albogriseolus TaxID=1887 RepID=UPI00224C7DA5|nr:DUF881 domain-containing protein [Streptomyces viridodiastaticus]MCX4565683.1 DUF881 domain-containing protein [Streptomyces viridodiastaticus]
MSEREQPETTRPAVTPPRSVPDTPASAPGASPPAGLRRELPAEVPPAAPRTASGRTGASEAPRTPHPPQVSQKPQASETPAADGPGEPGLTGRRRLVNGLWPPRVTRAQLIVALLLFGLGFGLAVQVASTSDTDSALRGARQEDLVRILDELDDRTERLEDEKQGLEKQREELENSSDQAEEARRQTIEKERQLGVLAGTVAAQGPGIEMTIEDTKGTVESDMLLDAIQELRAAGAEAIQVNGVRVVAGTYLSDADGGVSVDGNKIKSPYRFKVIGKPQDLEPALNIPGGVVQTLEKEQATVTVERTDKIVVDALRAPKRPDYARSSSR